MGYVRLKPERQMHGRVALIAGPKATRPPAVRILNRARRLADARAKHSSVAGDIDISLHAQGAHTSVIMSVQGRHQDGSPSGQIASHLEFGYYNVWAKRRLPGLHIMRDAKAAA